MVYDTCIFDLYGTLVDIRTDEEQEELWERLALFYAYYGAWYLPDELRSSYRRLTREMTAGYEENHRDTDVLNGKQQAGGLEDLILYSGGSMI